MAKLDSTETLYTGGRALASRLNPFIGYASTGETLENVSDGLAFMAIVSGALAEGCGDAGANGLALIFKGMHTALQFETQNTGGAL